MKRLLLGIDFPAETRINLWKLSGCGTVNDCPHEKLTLKKILSTETTGFVDNLK